MDDEAPDAVCRATSIPPKLPAGHAPEFSSTLRVPLMFRQTTKIRATMVDQLFCKSANWPGLVIDSR
jgi:hypothetical protein